MNRPKPLVARPASRQPSPSPPCFSRDCVPYALTTHYSKRASFVAFCLQNMLLPPAAAPPSPLELPVPITQPSHFLAWSATANGAAALRHLHWLAPTADVILARLQAELCFQVPSASKAYWLGLAQSKGIPVRSGSTLSWGHRISWADAKTLWHTRCSCQQPPGPLPALDLCNACGQARLSFPSAHPVPCVWCRQPGTRACLGCNHSVNFRPDCAKWNCGPHSVYGPSAEHNLSLCPDCSFACISIVASSPLRCLRPLVPSELHLHLENLAAQTQVGAGHNSACMSVLSSAGSHGTSTGTPTRFAYPLR